VLSLFWLCRWFMFFQNWFSPLKIVLFASLSILLSSSKPALNSYEPAYIPGEEIRYRVHYGFLTAGEAIMRLTDKYYFVNKRVCFRAEVIGNSKGAFDKIVKIRNVWGAYFDTINFQPQKAFRSIAENRYRKKEETYFDYEIKKASVKSEDDKAQLVDISPDIQDMVSGYYFLRLQNYDGLKKNDTLKMKGIFENKTYDFRILYLGKEKVKTRFGKAASFVISPIMPENSFFRGRHPIKMWISDDPNRIPLKIEAELLLGSVDLDIERYDNLKHPIQFD
jgi:hypothetical protein